MIDIEAPPHSPLCPGIVTRPSWKFSSLFSLLCAYWLKSHALATCSTASEGVTPRYWWHLCPWTAGSVDWCQGELPEVGWVHSHPAFSSPQRARPVGMLCQDNSSSNLSNSSSGGWWWRCLKNLGKNDSEVRRWWPHIPGLESHYLSRDDNLKLALHGSWYTMGDGNFPKCPDPPKIVTTSSLHQAYTQLFRKRESISFLSSSVIFFG